MVENLTQEKLAEINEKLNKKIEINEKLNEKTNINTFEPENYDAFRSPAWASRFEEKEKEKERLNDIKKNLTDDEKSGFIEFLKTTLFEIEGDNNVTTNPHLHLADLTSRERMKNYPTFKKYSKFDVSPAKKIKLK